MPIECRICHKQQIMHKTVLQHTNSNLTNRVLGIKDWTNRRNQKLGSSVRSAGNVSCQWQAHVAVVVDATMRKRERWRKPAKQNNRRQSRSSISSLDDFLVSNWLSLLELYAIFSAPYQSLQAAITFQESGLITKVLIYFALSDFSGTTPVLNLIDIPIITHNFPHPSLLP